jgi:hypothetical protein
MGFEDVKSDIESVGSSLADLEKTSFKTGIEFKGLLKTVTNAANSMDGAGKKWTIFSRFVSGTPIWKLQNYLRGSLGVLAEFSKASQENTKRMQEQNDIIVNNLKSYEKLQDRVTDLDKAYRKQSEGLALNTVDIGILDEIENTTAYALALKATGDEVYALAKARDMAQKQAKDMGKQEAEVLRSLKKSHAFDKDRLVLKEKLAKEAAKRQGFAEGSRAEKKFIKGAVRKEKKQMKEDQKGVLDDAREETDKATDKALFDPRQFKGVLLPFMPLVGLVKLAKMRAVLAVKGEEFAKGLAPLLDNLFRMSIFVIFGIIAFLLFAKAAYEIFKVLEEMGLIAEIKEFIKGLISIVIDVVKIIAAFIGGDYKKAFDMIEPLLFKIKDSLIEGAKLLVVLAWETLVAGFGLVMKFFDEFFNNPDFQTKVIGYAVEAGKIVLGLYMAKALLLQGLQLVAAYAWPLIMIVLISALLVSVWKKWSSDIEKFIVTAVGAVVKWITGIPSAIGAFIKAAVKWVADKINPFASGGITKEGLSLVGERGPELVALPKGSRVYSNSDSKKMAGSSSSVVNNFNITVNAKDLSDAELRRVAKQLGNDIFKNINRTSTGRGFV